MINPKNIFKLYIEFFSQSIKLKFTKKSFLVIIVLNTLSSILSIMSIYYIRPLLDNTLNRRVSLEKDIYTFAILTLVVQVIFALKKFIYKLIITRSIFKLEQSLSKRWSNNDDLITDQKQGNILTIFTDLTNKYEQFLIGQLERILYSPINFLFVFMMLLYSNYLVAILVATTIVITSVWNTKASKYTYESVKKRNAITSNNINFEKKIIEELENIKSIGAESYSINYYEKLQNDELNISKELYKIKEKTYRPAMFNEYFPLIICAVVSSMLIKNETISIGTFAAIFLLTSTVSLPFSHYLSGLNQIKMILPTMQNISVFLNGVNEGSNNSHKTAKQSSSLININEVDFYFEDKPILKNFSFKVNKGNKVAIVGKSGSGKSTLIKLLLGLYRPAKGFICVNGVIPHTNKESLWKSISYVDANNYIISGSILYNITLSKNDLTPKEIEKVYEIVGELNMSSFVNDNTFNDSLNSENVSLSGGESHKISLARALYKNSEIIILDEPTANLDSDSEDNFIKWLQKVDKTVILVTHIKELESVCDKIVKID